MSESEIEKYRTWCKENMTKKILGKIPNTFSILYRSEPFIQNPNADLTGRPLTEDISDYFINRLEEGGIDTTDISIRTSPLSWTIYFEVYYGLVQIEGNTITTSDLFNNRRALEEGWRCEMKIIEDIPMCLFDKFNIINYPEWGEVVTFNYDKIKSEILDNYMISGSKETMEKSYQDVLDIMAKFPNNYNMLSETTIDVLAKKPIEIRREEDRILNLCNTDEFRRLCQERIEIETNKPEHTEDLYIIDNGRRVTGPNYENWKARHTEWLTAYKMWFTNLEQDYKLCFKIYPLATFPFAI